MEKEEKNVGSGPGNPEAEDQYRLQSKNHTGVNSEQQ